jgi:nucleotide-binding universal stress UspA family protein
MYKRILVPVDGSVTSNKALAAALQMAREAGAQVRLVHVMDELVTLTGFEPAVDVLTIWQAQANKVLQEACASAQAAGVTFDKQLIEEPGERLGDVIAKAARAWPADLIVLGTHGRRGIGRMLVGSGAEQIIRLAPVPVLVIRGDDIPAPSAP